MSTLNDNQPCFTQEAVVPDFGEQTFDRTFGLRVRKARNGRQWSQRTLAEELEKHGAKLDPSAVTRIERGTREVKLREAAAIAAALAVPLQELAPPPTASLHEQYLACLGSGGEQGLAARQTLAAMAMYYAQDEYGVVSNSTVTFRAVAEELRMSGSVSLGWTDNAMSHMDVLLVLNPRQVGPSNRMDNRPRKLFIAVAGYGMFGFALDRNGPLHHAYLGEKLGMRPTMTTEALADLFNGVVAELTAVVE